jgi:hypothetical protein
MGEGVGGVFIGLKSSARPALKAYTRYLSTAVQRLFCMYVRAKGQQRMSVNPSVHPPTIAYVRTKRQIRRQILKMPF